MSATAPEEVVWGIAAVAPVSVAAGAEPIASAAGMSPVAAAGTGMPSEEVPGDTADRARGAVAVAAPPALDRVAVAAVAAAAVAAAAAGRPTCDPL